MKQTGELTIRLPAGLLGYPLQFRFHALPVAEHRSCLLVNGHTDVAPFPPAALPAFTGTTAPSDSLVPVCLSPFVISCPTYPHPCRKNQGLPGYRVFTISDMPCSQTPGKLHRLATCAGFVLISTELKASSFPCLSISRLHHFSLAAYGLPSRCPTLNSWVTPFCPRTCYPVVG